MKLKAGWLEYLRKNIKALDLEFGEELQLFTGGDLPGLVHCYVEPDFQDRNPAEDEEGVKESMPKFIGRLLGGSRGGNRQRFLLADAGMGKTSVLAMLQLAYLAGQWEDCDKQFVLLKLSPSTERDLESIEKPLHTVLLLDALDEDRSAWGNIRQRLVDLFAKTTGFYRVLWTCRTQFFPPTDSLINANTRILELDGVRCPVSYLSLFTEEQVDEFLQRKFPSNWFTRMFQKGRQNQQRAEQAKQIVLEAKDLCFRPMLLSYIDDLLEGDLEREEASHWNVFSVYAALVDKWLTREVTKMRERSPELFRANGAFDRYREALHNACKFLAMEMQSQGVRSLSEFEVQQILSNPNLDVPEELIPHPKKYRKKSAGSVFQEGYLETQELDALHQTVLKIPQLGRDSLLFGIPTEFKESLVQKKTGIEQVRQDLIQLNTMLELANGAVPLAIWLNNAAHLCGPIHEKALFEQVYQKVCDKHRHKKQEPLGIEEILLLKELENMEVGGKAMLNRLANGDFRLSHYSIQEFLVVWVVVFHEYEGALGSVPVTDQMLTFLASAPTRQRPPLNYFNLCNADLRGINLQNSDLNGAELDGADLERANLRGTDLRGANLKGTNLKNAIYDKKTLWPSGFDFTESGAIGPYTNLRGADLSGVDLSGVDLSGVDLSRANLSGVDLSGVDLSGANLSGANLSGAKSSGAKLKETNLNQAMYNEETQWPVGFSPAAKGAIKK